MEVEKEPDQKIRSRTRSATRFPKTYPTVVVAFSLKETYDDLATAQQMICNKYSPQDSLNSITPTNSIKSVKYVANDLSDEPKHVSGAAELLKTKEDKTDTIIVIEENTLITYQGNVEVSSKENIVTVTDITNDEFCHHENKESICQKNKDSNIFPFVDSLKNVTNDQTEEVKQILDYSLSTEYSVEEDSRESNAICLGNSQEPDGFNNEHENLITEIRYDNEKIEMDESPTIEKCENNEIETADNIHEIIFIASKNHERRKETKFSKRKIKKHKTVRKNHFKSNCSKNVIRTQFDSYYTKKKIKIMCPVQIKKELYADSNISLISRERVLKNVLAKENMIEEIDLTYVKNTSSNVSVVSVPSTAKKSCTSNVSDNTLTRKDSIILQKEKEIDTVNSVGEVAKVYNSGVIVVAAAITYDINDTTITNTAPPNQHELMNLECLTSTETLKALDENATLISESNSLTSSPQLNEVSEETLINNESSFEISSSFEAYYNAKTSSELKIDNDSNYTQIYETAFHQINEKEQRSLLNSVINLGLYPDTPSTSSAATNENIQDNVIVTDVKKYSYDAQYVDGNFINDLNKNFIKKTNIKPSIQGAKTVILPNQRDIQALIEENEMLQRKCTEEARNPTNINETLWERLVSVIDLAVIRLEDTLTDKIINELKKSLAGFPSSRRFETNKDVEMMSGDIAVFDKEVSTREIKTDNDQGLQCDLIHNNVIDEIMKQLSQSGPQIITKTSKSFPKIKPNNNFGDVVEVLKPPLSPIVLEKGDTVTISTLTHGSEYQRFSRLTTMFRPPINFIRENVIVLTSVPTFFVVLLCLYGLVILIMNP